MSYKDVPIIRFLDGKKQFVNDSIVCETPLTIFVNEYEIVTLLCTPQDQKALVFGFLASSGLIKSAADIHTIEFFYEETVAKVTTHREVASIGLRGRRTLTSGCGSGITFYNSRDCNEALDITSSLQVSSNCIFDLMRKMQESADLFDRTGGSHTVALANQYEILCAAEDIGRHNAVDKVIGEGLLANVSFDDKIILASGRISSDMVLKCLKCGFPVVASRSAPTEMAVRLARLRGLTLLGFVRGRRMNIYSGEQRISEA